MKNNKGFTLVELMLGIVIFGTIAGLATYAGVSIVKKISENSATVVLYSLKADSERVASRRNYTAGDERLLSFPLTTSEFIEKSRVANVILTEGESINKNYISVKIKSESEAIYAIKINDKCIVMLHTLYNRDKWATSENPCIADNFKNNQSWGYEI